MNTFDAGDVSLENPFGEEPRTGFASPSEIARLAGVGPSTVSNWRRRHPDFPAPAAGSDARPLFDWAEVRAWLASSDRANEPSAEPLRGMRDFTSTLRAALPGREMFEIVSPVIVLLHLARMAADVGRLPAAAGGAVVPPEISNQAVEELANPGLPLTRFQVWLRDTEPSLFDLVRSPQVDDDGSVRANVADALRTTTDLTAAYDGLLQKHQEVLSSQLAHSSPQLLADLCQRIALPTAELLLDPAVGFGMQVLALASAGATAIGMDVSDGSGYVFRQRALLRNVRADFYRTNAFESESVAPIRADIVVAQPPFGQRFEPLEAHKQGDRFQFGIPQSSDAELAWLELAISFLSPTGEAYVLTTNRPTFQTTPVAKQIRSELVRRGSLRAVIALPGGVLPDTSISTTLWILGRPKANLERGVLMIDASEVRHRELLDFIADAVKLWRTANKDKAQSPARVVPQLELLQGDCVLVPRRWVLVDEGRDADHLLHRADRALAEVRIALSTIGSASDVQVSLADGSVSHRTIGELVGVRALKVFNARSVSGKSSDAAERGYRVVRESDFTSAGRLKIDGSPIYLPEDAGQGNMVLLRAGDVVVYFAKKEVRAVVWTESEPAVIGGNLRLIRLAEGQSEIDPEFLAACIGAVQNQRFVVGSAMPHLNLNEFEIPVLPLAQQRRTGRGLDRLARLEAELREASVKVATARRAMADLAATGHADFSEGQ